MFERVYVIGAGAACKMIDWEGLLKFSLQFADGTHKSQFKEMSGADKKWLQDAIGHYCNSEIERMRAILLALEGFQVLAEEQVEGMLEELQELLDSLDKGATLYKLQGHITLLRIVFYGKHTPSRVLAMQILSSANQNDSYVQNISINTGALELIQVVTQQTQMALIEHMLGLVSAIVRGENLQAKRIFIRVEGLNMIEKLMSQSHSPKLEHRLHILIRDLLFYDDRLHLSFNDLSSFNNTADLSGLKREGEGLSYDPNKQQAAMNELSENKEFKGSVRRFFHDPTRSELLKGYLVWLQRQIKEEAE